MRKAIGTALSAITMACLAVPYSPSFAQAGISTNPVPLATKDYLAAVHALSRYEVASSRLALTRSQVRASLSFAREMVNHHASMVAEHARLLNIPSTSDSGSALVGPLSEMLNSLENVPRADFDVAYKRGQIAAHEEALKVHGAYAARGSDAAMRAKARKTMPVIRKHLDAARKLPGA